MIFFPERLKIVALTLAHQLSSPPQAGQHSSSGRITRVSRGSEAGNGLRAEDWRRAEAVPGHIAHPAFPPFLPEVR